MTTHSKLSPSARSRWGVCPASVRESAKYPEQRSGAAAIDGTHSHTLLEKCLDALPMLGTITDPAEFIGTTLKDDDGEFTVDAERAARVRVATQYIGQAIINDPLCQVISETRVHPDSLVGRDDMSGTVDVQIISGDGIRVELIDYKDGMNPVEAKGNHQLEQYAVGVVAEILNRGELAPVWITATIIQPKLSVKGMPAVTSHKYTLAEIMAVRDKLIAEGAAVDAPDAPFVPGENQCKYCAHKGACTALVGQAMQASGVVFQNVSHQAANKDPATMDDLQLLEVMESAPLVRQMLDAVEAEAQRRLEAGVVIPGLKLVNGRGTRAWALDEDEMVLKLKKFGIPKDMLYVSKLVSPVQAEKLAWVKGEEQKRLSDRQLELMKKEYVTTVVGKPTIALESDPRKAVVVSAAAMFEPVTPSWLS